jgi:hypothetical protein
MTRAVRTAPADARELPKLKGGVQVELYLTRANCTSGTSFKERAPTTERSNEINDPAAEQKLEVRSCAGFWTPAASILSARSDGRRPKSARARSRGELGSGLAASAMGISG